MTQVPFALRRSRPGLFTSSSGRLKPKAISADAESILSSLSASRARVPSQSHPQTHRQAFRAAETPRPLRNRSGGITTCRPRCYVTRAERSCESLDPRPPQSGRQAGPGRRRCNATVIDVDRKVSNAGVSVASRKAIQRRPADNLAGKGRRNDCIARPVLGPPSLDVLA
jgi:hypothetical protein